MPREQRFAAVDCRNYHQNFPAMRFARPFDRPSASLTLLAAKTSLQGRIETERRPIPVKSCLWQTSPELSRRNFGIWKNPLPNFDPTENPSSLQTFRLEQSQYRFVHCSKRMPELTSRFDLDPDLEPAVDDCRPLLQCLAPTQ